MTAATVMVRRPLFRKYVGLFVAVVSLALLANGALEIWFSYQEHKASLIRIQREQAEAAAAKIGQFVKEIESQLGWTTQLPWSASTVEQRRFDGLRLLRQVPAITELSMVDAAGKEQLRVSRLAMDVVGSGLDVSKEPKFAETVARKVYYGPVYFRRESEPYMTLALAGTRRDAGVSIAEVNLKLIWEVISKIKVGERGHAYVVDAQGRLIAHPDISLVLRNTDMSGLTQVRAARAGEAGAAEDIQVAENPQGRPMLTAHAPVAPLGWLVFVEMPLDEANAPLFASIQRTGVLMLGALVLAAFAGLFLARKMIVPIRTLRAGAERLGGGDLTQRIAVTTGDELEALAHQFNDMAGRLQESYADLEMKVEDRTRELQESLEYQTATSDVLNVISRSPSQIQPVLDTIVETASRLCEAHDAVIRLRDGEWLRIVAHHGPIPVTAVSEKLADRSWVTGRAVVDRTPIHVDDLAAAGDEFPEGQAMALQLGHRTTLAVPLLRENVAIGAILIRRAEVRPFSEKQVAVLQTFADQAVIAIENVRLFDEVQARTRELSQALEQQTATSEVLQAISRSTFDLPTVLNTLAESVAKLCGADQAAIARESGTVFYYAAAYGFRPEVIEYLMSIPHERGRGSAIGRALSEGRIVQIPDVLADPEYEMLKAQEMVGFRTVLGVPLMRQGNPIGVIALNRLAVQPFTQKQIDLVGTFADQAVIAIENARLFDEVQARTRELSETLEQQTATSDVLRVISNSLTDTQPVFDAIVQSGLKLFSGAAVSIALPDRNQVKAVAVAESNPERADAWWHRFPFPLTREYMHGLAILDRRMVDVPDVREAPPELETGKQNFLGSGYRAVTIMPMMRGDAAIGVLSVVRVAPGPLTEKQLAALKTFASQAVIAIENTRLLNELQTRTRELARAVEEQRALGEVTQAVNSTIELQTVLNTIVAKAVQLSATEAGAIYVFSNGRQEFRLRATYGMSDDLIATIKSQKIRAGETPVGQAAAKREPLQIPDLRDQPRAYVQDIILAAGYRALLVVPLLRPDRIVGALVVRRREPGLFPQSTVDLLQTFAAQSVLAIQNARLFSEIEEKGRQLEIASRHKSQFLANMSHELRTPLNSVLGFTEMLADGLYGELPARAITALEKVQNNGRHLLGLINDVLDLSKIEAGQLTLALEDYSMAQVVSSVVTNTESLARAKGLALTTTVAPALPMGRGDERRLTQVLINLVGNAVKFTDAGSVDISARAVDGFFEIAVRDTGPGIAPEDQTRIFDEFQQVDDSSTRKKGGSGLGLAISRRIVEMHGGDITVESELGKGATFRVVVPVRAAEEREAA
jgi:signal transduction histidine kinase